MADKGKSLLNSILFIVRSSIPHLNIIPLLRRADGVKGPAITIIRRRKRGVNLSLRRRVIKGKIRVNGLIIILNLSLKSILYLKPSLRRLR